MLLKIKGFKTLINIIAFRNYRVFLIRPILYCMNLFLFCSCMIVRCVKKAGIFRGAEAEAEAAAAAAARVGDVEEGEEGSGGRRDETVDISSENSGPARSRSEDEFMINADDDDDDDGAADDKSKNKKRKKYHRHTVEQIREMEAYVLFFLPLIIHSYC